MSVKGYYSQLEINRGLPANMMVKYFERDGSHWRIKEDLRNFVNFQSYEPLRSLALYAANGYCHAEKCSHLF